MYCEKCGAEIDEEAAFCEICGAQNNIELHAKGEKVEPIIVAEKAIFTRNFYIVLIIIELLCSTILMVFLISVEEKASLRLTEMKYSSFDNYFKISKLEDQLESMRSIFTAVIVGNIIMVIISILGAIPKMIRIQNTCLLLTNVGVIGNTGDIFSDKSLNVLYQEITNAYLKKEARKYGWIVIEIEFVEKYSFFIKEPGNFLYYLNKQMKKTQQ